MTELSTRKRFGVIDDDQQRAMSGLEYVQGLVDARCRSTRWRKHSATTLSRFPRAALLPPQNPMRGISTPPARFMAALPQPCSTPAWDSPSVRDPTSIRPL